MSEAVIFLIYATFIGVGATAIMDIWAMIQRRLLGVPSLDYAMVGRWLGHIQHGRFAHAPISAAPPIPNEALIGWTAHYAIGVVFAAVLLAICGMGWAQDPSLVPALVIGLATVAAPFFILQPALGAGIAAARMPNPNIARIKSVTTHLVFGLGLYITAEIAALLIAAE